MTEHAATAAPLAAFAIIVNPADNVAVVKTELGPGFALGCPTAARSPTPAPSRRGIALRDRARSPLASSSCSTVSRSARRAGSPKGTLITPEHDQRRAGRARPAGRTCTRRRPSTCPTAERAHVHGLPPRRRPRRHAQLPADRADQHVREPRGRSRSRRSAEFTIYRREKFPERRRRRRDPAQQGLRLLGRLEHRGDAADARRTTPTHPNVGGVIFIGLGCEKTNLTAVEQYLQHEQLDLGKPVVRIRHPGHRRHAGGHRARPPGGGGHAAGRSTRRRARRPRSAS